MPNSVAASTSTSSTPMLYLAIIRRWSDASMIRRVIGELRIEDPQKASLPRANSYISSSSSPCGLCQPALPRTTSHPASAKHIVCTRLAAHGSEDEHLSCRHMTFLQSCSSSTSVPSDLAKPQYRCIVC